MTKQQLARLAASDPQVALKVARALDDPWTACQTLGWVARFAPEACVEAIVDEAIRAGRRAEDPYRIVGSAAWPLRALVERGRMDRLESVRPGVMSFALRIVSHASRSEAIFLIYQAVFPAGRRYWLTVFQELALASQPAIHWRQTRNIRDAVLMAAKEDPDFARDFRRDLRNARAKAQIERRLALAEYRSPRVFFW